MNARRLAFAALIALSSLSCTGNIWSTEVSFTVTSSSIGESTTPHAIEVRLDQASRTPVTVNYAATGGTATNGTDYNLASGTLTFAPDEISKSISLVIRPDSAAEADETVVVSLSAPVNATLASPRHTAVIVDDDLPTIAFTASSSSAGEELRTHVLTVALSQVSGKRSCAATTVTAVMVELPRVWPRNPNAVEP